MTNGEIDRLVAGLVRDLRLGPAEKYELSNVARRFAGMEDAAIRAEAMAMGNRSTQPILAGAVGVLAAGICEGRYQDALSPAERVKRDQSLTGIGCCLIDSGAMTFEED